MIHSRFVLGDREVDLEQARVTRGAETIPLTPNEVRLLQVLVARAGTTVDRDRLLVEGLGYRKPVATRAIDQAIWRLRRKLEPDGPEARFLLSDHNNGYRLELEPPDAAPAVVGRGREIEHLLGWIDGGAREIWLIGPPGSGRSTLARAVDHHRPSHATRWRIAVRMPEASDALVLRVGPLAQAAGRELLVRTVLATRAEVELPADERSSLAELADRVDHHPGALVALGRRALLERVEELAPAVDPALVAFVSSQPAELLADLADWLAFPDPLEPADVEAMGAPRERLAQAWRHALVERIDGRFAVLAPVRSAVEAVRGPPSDAARERFVARVRAQVEPLNEAAYTRADDTSRAALDLLRRRLERAVEREPDRDELLLAWLVTDATDRGLSQVRPTTPNARVAVAILRAEHLEPADPDGARWELEAVADQAPSPLFALMLGRTRLQLELRRSAPPEVLVPLVQAAVHAERCLGTPFARMNARQAEGILHGRLGRWAECDDCLLEALRESRQAGAGWMSVQLMQNLAALAYRDGRVREGAAWCREALDAPLSPQVEARFRTTLVTHLLAQGEADEAREQLGLVELLEVDDRRVLPSRVALDLLEGRVERAVVRLSAALVGDLPEGDRRALLFLAFWGHLLLGRPTDAAPFLDRILAVAPPAHSRDGEMLAMARAVLAALSGDSVGVRAALGEVRPDSSRRWPAVVRVVEALVERAGGRPVDREAVEREVTAGGIGDLSLRFALDLLGPARPAERGRGADDG